MSILGTRTGSIRHQTGRAGATLPAALVVVGAVAALSVTACAPKAAPVTDPFGVGLARGGAARTLRADLDRLFDAPPFSRSVWAVAVRSAERGDTLYARNAGMLVMPASNTKIVTTSTTAEMLGWDYAFETRLYADGPIAGGVLAGDLVVVGGGDPTINGRGGSPTRVFEAWADRLRALGITQIAGRIVGDGRAFPGDRIGRGWSWDYLGDGYAAPVSALQFNENVAELVVTPGASEGAPAEVSLRQPEAGLRLDASVTTAKSGEAARLDVSRLFDSPVVHVRGRVPAGGAPSTRSLAVDDPTGYFVRSLHRTLGAKGLVVGGDAVAVDPAAPTPEAAGMRLLFTHKSPPLSEVATTLMKVSQNLYAETLLRTLGGSGGEASTDRGLALSRATLEKWGVPRDAFLLVDGSGLSRYNYLSAEAIVRILAHIYADPRHREPFLATLPVAGQDGGTVARRMRGTPAEGNARAKTGSIANVRALSGYVKARNGETLIFSILANSFSVSSSVVDETTDKAVVRLATFTRARD